MIKRHRTALNVAFLLTFLFITLFVNFVHTERSLSRHDSCPACSFLQYSLTTSQINFFHLPPLLPIDLLRTRESLLCGFILSIPTSSRSPPQA